MKFEVAVTKDKSLKIVDFSYTFGDFPTIGDFISMTDRLMRRVVMVGFNEWFLIPMYNALEQSSSGFKRPGYYVVVEVSEDRLIDHGPPVYIVIHQRA